MPSSVPGFKAAIEMRWKAVAKSLDPNILVSWGNPHPDKMPARIVILDDTKNHALQFVAAMTQANETYDVSCYISVTGRVQNSRQGLWDSAYALYFALVTDIIAWNQAGGFPAGVNVVVPVQSHDQDALTSDIREASIMFDLAVTARIALV